MGQNQKGENLKLPTDEIMPSLEFKEFRISCPNKECGSEINTRYSDVINMSEITCYNCGSRIEIVYSRTNDLRNAIYECVRAESDLQKAQADLRKAQSELNRVLEKLRNTERQLLQGAIVTPRDA